MARAETVGGVEGLASAAASAWEEVGAAGWGFWFNFSVRRGLRRRFGYGGGRSYRGRLLKAVGNSRWFGRAAIICLLVHFGPRFGDFFGGWVSTPGVFAKSEKVLGRDTEILILEQ